MLRIKNSIAADNLSLVAAGVAFYSLLAAFPALAATISVYGLVFDPQEGSRQMAMLADIIPGEARSVLLDQLRDLSSTGQTTLGIGLATSVLLALWGASQGTRALFAALNIVYGEKEQRSLGHLLAVTLLFTAIGILFMVTALALIAVLPILVDQLGLGEYAQGIARWARWPVLGIGTLIVLAATYRYGPDRNSPQWQWVSWGSLAAVLLWLGVSGLFSLYVSSFGNYNATYGGIGAVVVLLMWFYLSAFLVLLGGKLNAELEHQTRIDSTAGEAERMGDRGAHVADTLGEIP